VPVTLAKNISDPLHTMMNSREMKEGRDGKASIEEVHSDTFIGFCEFAYTGDYRVPNGIVDLAKSKDKSLSNIRAAAMSIPQTTEYSFDLHPMRDEPEHASQCVEEDMWGLGMKSRANEIARLAELKATTAKKRYEYLWEEFCSLNYNRILPEADAELDGDGMKEIEFKPLLFHCKLYVFAQMYLIASLKQLTLCKLHAELKVLDLRPETSDEVLETLEFAYTKTERGYDCKDELRHLLVAYAASKTDVLKQNAAFHLLLDAHGELGSDMVLALG